MSRASLLCSILSVTMTRLILGHSPFPFACSIVETTSDYESSRPGHRFRVGTNVLSGSIIAYGLPELSFLGGVVHYS